MKIVLDIKSGSKSTDFKRGDTIMYDGSKWYVTTKDELFRELEERCNKAISDYDRKYNDLSNRFENFLKEYTVQNSKLIPILEELLGREK